MKGREGSEGGTLLCVAGLVGRREKEEEEEEASSKIRQECSLEKGMDERRADGEREGGTMFAHNYVSNLDRPFPPSFPHYHRFASNPRAHEEEEEEESRG